MSSLLELHVMLLNRCIPLSLQLLKTKAVTQSKLDVARILIAVFIMARVYVHALELGLFQMVKSVTFPVQTSQSAKAKVMSLELTVGIANFLQVDAMIFQIGLIAMVMAAIGMKQMTLSDAQSTVTCTSEQMVHQRTGVATVAEVFEILIL
jgi:hypothetical protein